MADTTSYCCPKDVACIELIRGFTVFLVIASDDMCWAKAWRYKEISIIPDYIIQGWTWLVSPGRFV